MNLSPVFKQRFFDSNGLPLAGGQLFSYVAGTTTPQATYSNATGTANTNPVILDASGYADVFLDPSLAYKFILKDVNNNVLWTEDNIVFAVGIAPWNSTSIYQQGNIVVDTAGTGMLFVSLTNNNQNNALTSIANWRVFQGQERLVASNTQILITDDIIRSNSTSGNLTHTLSACATTPIGKRITIKDIGTGGFGTTVQGSGSDNIDGANIYGATLKQYASLTVFNNGVSWDVLSLPGLSVSWTTKTTGYTIGGADTGIIANFSTAATLTLPQASAFAGKVYYIKSIGSAICTIAPNGSDKIDGEASQVLNLYSGVILTSDGGTNWYAF